MESLKLAPRVASRPYRKDRSTTIAWRWLLAMALGFTISAAYASTLVRGFAGTSPDDFGTQALAAGDDNSSGPISLTSVFPGGINYFGQVYSSFYVNNNGNITFKGQEGAFTPVQFPSSTEPMIAPFWADVDTRGIALPHLNLVFYAFDATSIYVTWDYVGYYNHGVDKLDAFQIVLTNRSDVGPGDFDVEFIYEQLQWDSGGASNGIPAQIGFDAGDGINYVKQKDSFTDNVLTVTGTSNIGIPGVWKWEVRNGAVGEPPFLIQISQPAPSATIEAGANVSFAASTTNDVSIAVMDFYVDQTKIGSNSGSPASVAIPPNDLPVGQHTLRVVAQNETGQSEAVSESVTVVDTTGPTVDNVTYAGTPFSSNSTITDNGILAAHISDFSGISTVVVMIDGTSTFGGVLTNGQFTSPINFDQIPNGQHTLTITAIDNANNSTIVTYPLTLAIPPPPRPSINTPSGGTIETNPIVQVTGGSVPQSQVQMYVNGVASGSPIVAQSDEVFATSVVLPSEGTFTLTADATTLHGTSSLSSPVTISYDISGPKIQNVQYGGSAFVDGSTLTTVASLTAQISDQSAVASINVTLDGNPLSGGALVNQSYSIPLGLDQITNGSHTVGISAVDIVGNASSVSISFTLAIPPPQAPTILAPQNGTKTNQASPTVSGSSVAGSQVQLYLDDVATGSLIAASASNTFSGSVTIGGEGTHQISSDARNTRGTSARSAAVQVIYDTTPPSIQNVTFQGVAFASGATVTSAGTLAAQATDANGIASVSATIDGTAVAGGVLAGPQFTRVDRNRYGK